MENLKYFIFQTNPKITAADIDKLYAAITVKVDQETGALKKKLDVRL